MGNQEASANSGGAGEVKPSPTQGFVQAIVGGREAVGSLEGCRGDVRCGGQSCAALQPIEVS